MYAYVYSIRSPDRFMHSQNRFNVLHSSYGYNSVNITVPYAIRRHTYVLRPPVQCNVILSLSLEDVTYCTWHCCMMICSNHLKIIFEYAFHHTITFLAMISVPGCLCDFGFWFCFKWCHNATCFHHGSYLYQHMCWNFDESVSQTQTPTKYLK